MWQLANSCESTKLPCLHLDLPWVQLLTCLHRPFLLCQQFSEQPANPDRKQHHDKVPVQGITADLQSRQRVARQAPS